MALAETQVTDQRWTRGELTMLAVALVAWVALLAPLTLWGLPTSAHDPLLFGDAPPWPAEAYEIDEAFAELRNRNAGADTDLDPLAARDRAVNLTADHAARARLLLRYRLFSRQPDEMVTFRALARMNPRAGDFDPRLYQYGGAFVYLVGAALGAAHVLGLVTLTSNVGVYLEQPELFARFYVVARSITLLFGAGALAAVYVLGRRAGGRKAGWLALVLAATAPVVLSCALEAKPHLPSACCLLWAIVFTARYLDTRRTGAACALGAAGGLAAGFALTGGLAVVLWPVCYLGAQRDPRRLAQLSSAALVAGLVYALTNPYVLINALTNPAVLRSNLGTTAAMFETGPLDDGAANIAGLLVESIGFGTPLLALVAVVWLARTPATRHGAVWVPAAGLAGAFLVVTVAIGASEPAEFARFLLVPGLLAAVAAGTLVAQVIQRRRVIGVLALLIGLVLQKTPTYVQAFLLDASIVHESRYQAGVALKNARAVGVFQEPAPYSIPPLDFTRTTVYLLPSDADLANLTLDRPLDAIVFTADRPGRYALPGYIAGEHYAPWGTSMMDSALPPQPQRTWARITWANQPTFLFERTSAPPVPALERSGAATPLLPPDNNKRPPLGTGATAAE